MSPRSEDLQQEDQNILDIDNNNSESKNGFYNYTSMLGENGDEDDEEEEQTISNPFQVIKRQQRSTENKKLVFLSKKVLEEVESHPETTGTNVR